MNFNMIDALAEAKKFKRYYIYCPILDDLINKMNILDLIRKQKDYFIYLADGKRHITNSLLYHSYEDELRREQEKIGRENKKKIIAYCKEKGIKIPNFRKEGIEK